MTRNLRLRRQHGLSLIELMIAIALGLVLLAGMSVVYMSNSKTREELEKVSRQIENGRYAMQLLSEDIQTAGYMGSYYESAPTAPATLPDPCSTDINVIKGDARLLHVQGYDNPSSTTIASLSCLSDVKSGTDILVVRRASTCAAGATNCDAFLANAPHLQVSGCPLDAVPYKFGTVQTDFTGSDGLRKVGCSATADVLRFRTHIYFVANNNVGSDGVPTLKRVELGSAMTIVPLVEGIENLQLEYGIDSSGDGVPDSYTADPNHGCTGAACAQNWWNTMAVKINLLARNTQATTGYSDAKTYTLGLDADGNANTFTSSDAYKRHEYSALVRVANPAGRRQ